MRIALLIASALASLSLNSAEPAAAQARSASSKPSGGLTAFRSDAELRAYLRRLRRDEPPPPPTPVYEPMPSPPPLGRRARAQLRRRHRQRRQSRLAARPPPESPTTRKPMSTRAGSSRCAATRSSSFAGAGCSPSRSPAARMRPVHSIDAFPPGVSGRGDWYDEMLISGDRVIVVGYCYARGGTEINRFRLDAPAGSASRTPGTSSRTIIIRRATTPRG